MAKREESKKENGKKRKKAKPEIFVLAHDIRSVHNVGSFFRTADAAGVTCLYLSGYTPTPLDRFGRPRSDLAKVSLGSEKNVPWRYEPDPVQLIRMLKKEKVQIVALEQDKKAVDYKKVKVSRRTLVILGNETEGIGKNFLQLADVVAEIPMRGEKESLNVAVAFGIALYRFLDL